MFKSSIKQDNNDPDIIFYNAQILCDRTEDQGADNDPIIRFAENRPSGVVDDISKYDFSIVRFTLNGSGADLPLFIPKIMENQSDPNKTIYSVTLAFNNITSSQVFINYASESINATVPQPPMNGKTQDLNSKYYYVYTYQHMVDLVNIALETAFSNLQRQVQSTYGVFITKQPNMQYNPVTGLFSLYTDSYGFGEYDRTSQGSAKDENFTLYFNSNMYHLFRNFSNQYIGGEQFGMTNKILIQNKLGLNTYTDPVGTKYYVTTQDYISTSTGWAAVSAIVFASTMIPIVAEAMSAPVVFKSNVGNVTVTSNNLNQPIITDISLPLDRADQYKGFIQYNPSGEYRMSCLNGSGPLNMIDIGVYWRHRNGDLFPITMPNGASCTLKIMFRKKKQYL